MSVARAGPAPNTVWVPRRQRSHARHVAASRRSATSDGRRSRAAAVRAAPAGRAGGGFFTSALVGIVRPVVGRRRIEFPAMTIAVLHLLTGQLFVVLVRQTDRLAD